MGSFCRGAVMLAPPESGQLWLLPYLGVAFKKLVVMEHLSSGQNWIWICLFCLQNFWKNHPVDLTKCLILPHTIPHSIASKHETDFLSNKSQQWAQAHGIHWVYHVPHRFEAVGLIG